MCLLCLFFFHLFHFHSLFLASKNLFQLFCSLAQKMVNARAHTHCEAVQRWVEMNKIVYINGNNLTKIAKADKLMRTRSKRNERARCRPRQSENKRKSKVAWLRCVHMWVKHEKLSQSNQTEQLLVSSRKLFRIQRNYDGISPPATLSSSSESS